MLHLLRVEMVINSPWIMPILGTKELASPEKTAPGRYVAPTGRVIVATGRYVVLAGPDNESDEASVHNETTNTQQQPNIQPQIITTISNNNAKFPYLKKDKYEVWAMKMEYWITNNDMNIWKRNTLQFRGNQRDIWNAVKARFGGNAESKKIRKSMLKQEFLEFRIDVKGYTTFSSSQSAGPSHFAFVSATSASKKMSYGDSPSYSLNTTYSASSNSKTGSHRSSNHKLNTRETLAYKS
uniref:Uncharacterized protein n=1 Tax=Tanacetum cinerariifolium TaxID=118510 RepID=A0A6L2P5Y2_TANCI|nr:hypothetical protein [Tanacetum cinerariifolium]